MHKPSKPQQRGGCWAGSKKKQHAQKPFTPTSKLGCCCRLWHHLGPEHQLCWARPMRCSRQLLSS